MRFSTQQSALWLTCFGVFNAAVCLAAEPQRSPATRIERTAFTKPASAKPPIEPVTFGHRTTKIGDQTEQTVDLDVRLMLTMRRANEVLGKHQSTIRTHQRRVLTT